VTQFDARRLSVDVEAVEGSPRLVMSDAESRRLRQALVARYGVEQGVEAWHDAVAYSWQHRERLAGMTNPVGYLFRVAQTSVRTQRRAARRFDMPPVDPARFPEIEPGLEPALAALTERQRTVVLLVHAYGWTQREAAEVLDMDVSTLRNHLQRGMDRLRRELGADDA
jgi:RNA polymerase sigma factor (sigma-70 family)